MLESLLRIPSQSGASIPIQEQESGCGAGRRAGDVQYLRGTDIKGRAGTSLSQELLENQRFLLSFVQSGEQDRDPEELIPTSELLLFAVGRMNTSSVTRQLWSIWEVLITMQHKKPSLCRLYQPLQSWKAPSDPGGALELSKLTQKKNLFIWTVHREQGGGLEGTPLGDLHVVTWPWQGQLGRAAQDCPGTSGGVHWGGRMDTGSKSSNTPWELFLLEKGRKNRLWVHH